MLGRISHNRVVSTVFRVIINFFRGIPSLLLIYFFFLVIPSYGIKMPSFWMLTLPIALTASGVLAEVFRAGVNAVPKGQREAALSIGMTEGKVMRKIILPQAIRYVIPSLISQLVVVVKDTSVAHQQLRRARLGVLRGGDHLHPHQLRNQPVGRQPGAQKRCQGGNALAGEPGVATTTPTRLIGASNV